MTDVLTQILADKVVEVARAKKRCSFDVCAQRARATSPARGFIRSLTDCVARDKPAIIAEMKRASPSRGVLRSKLDPVEVALEYARSGAGALSVLTDEVYFQGSVADLEAARAACSLPVLRKDFIVDPYQIVESRAIGADAILLIVAALSDDQLKELAACAYEYGIDVLIEIHDRDELLRALAIPHGLIGINNRDLRTFVTNVQTTLSLAVDLPPDQLIITESGIKTPEDVRTLRAAGIRGFLVGEAFMVAENPGKRLVSLFEGWV